MISLEVRNLTSRHLLNGLREITRKRRRRKKRATRKSNMTALAEEKIDIVKKVWEKIS